MLLFLDAFSKLRNFITVFCRVLEIQFCSGGAHLLGKLPNHFFYLRLGHGFCVF